jgi:Txe/YoeB family toxin of Txe-Axe toxin-antitoxin module
MRRVSFLPAAFKDYVEWSSGNREMFDKINELIKEIQRDPFKGKGKPEPLKATSPSVRLVLLYASVACVITVKSSR